MFVDIAFLLVWILCTLSLASLTELCVLHGLIVRRFGATITGERIVRDFVDCVGVGVDLLERCDQALQNFFSDALCQGATESVPAYTQRLLRRWSICFQTAWMWKP
jgi:hypothetical protein